jgi:parallel beta-helix repeat protein
MDCDVTTNTADGIRCAGSGSVIRGNVCASNGLNAGNGAGIVVVSIDNKVEGNHCTGGDRGIDVTSAGNLIVRNTCANNTVNWSIVVGNSFGPIIVAGTNAAAVSGNSAASTLASTDPNVNMTY